MAQGQLAASGAPAAQPLHRPILVAILAVLTMLFGILSVILGLLLMVVGGIVGFLFAGPTGGLVGAGLGLLVILFGAVEFVAGLGLWRMRGWAWWLSTIVTLLGLASSLGGGRLGATGVFALVFVYLLLVRKHFTT